MNAGETQNAGKEKSGWLARSDRANFLGERRFPSPREVRREETLEAWIGTSRKAEVFADLRPETPSLNFLLDGLLGSFAENEVNLLENLRGSWRDLLGPALASQVSPADLRDKVLFLEVHNSSWLYVFERQHKPKIKEILIGACNGCIQDVRFVQKGRFSR